MKGSSKKEGDTKKKSKEELKEEKLKKKYGVTKEIPKQKISDDNFKNKLSSKSSDSEIGSLTDLVLKTEKLEGKFDIISGYRNELNERIAQMSEEIGELRTMILETERSFGKVEKNFQEIKEVVGDIEPLKVRKGFEKKEQEIMENAVKIEKIENLVRALEKESKDFRKTMERIKSFDNLVDLSKKINGKIEEIEDTKKYSDRTAAKIETIFSEITDKVNELQGQKEKISKLDELTTEITQMLDEMSIKMKNSVDSKGLESFKKDIREEIQKIGISKEKIEKVSNLIDETDIKNKLKEMKGVLADLSNIENKMEKFNSEINKKSKILNKVDKKIREMETIKKESEKNAEKIEDVFSEITNEVSKFQKERESVAKFFKLINETGIRDELDRIGEIEEKIINFNSKVDSKSRHLDDNRERLLELERRLIPEINKIKQRLNEVDKLPDLPRKVPASSHKIEKIKKIIEKQNNVISDLINSMEKVRNIPNINIKELNNLGLSLRFYQLLNILPFLEDRIKLKEYSKEMKDIIRKMKDSDVWGDREEKFMNDLLKVSKKISVPANQEEFLDKINNIASWTSGITDEIKEIKKTDHELKNDLEDIKKRLGEKVDSKDIEDVYIVERELMALKDKFDKLKSVAERQNFVVDDVLERVTRVESEEIEGLRESVDKLREVVKNQNFVINELLTKLKEREIKIDKDSIEDIKTSTRFYQLLNMLPYVIEPSRIKAYLMELKELIEFLKSNEKWDSEKERFMKNFLSSLSDNYKSRGYEEIGSAYGEVI
ncbi:MAG: hypothetical protein GF368_04375 [Candidatus Aenigmarchaeota archaeon]|nr:hypothetical protein [Candidatus Aenigmarchaeota archaeon]